jgi:stage II sporulation protein AA (anti-sigma F factor antagonist)
MKVHESSEGAVHIIAPEGRIDTTTSAGLEEVLRRVLDDGALDVLVDFSLVDYISSAGLRVFLVLARRTRDAEGRLVLCGMRPAVRQVFHLAGFMPLFTVEKSRESAVAAFGSEA